MADINLSFKKTFKNEGGYTHNSHDTGKETYKGISIVFNPDWPGWKIIHKTIKSLGINNTLDCSLSTRTKIDNALENLPELQEQVIKLYKVKYWDPLNLDNEPNQIIADSVFDSAVLIGVMREKKSIEDARKKADEII
ncbi:MAG: glycosyl hydrolase 108 family protein [Candidatus Paceibacterota bacterium]|jgi:lysozyme family protein